jgi:two-component system CheB/CheR fusion protein
MLGIEVWDTGIGIQHAQFQAIFEEYHQVDNAARERSRGLGLGLSIVRRLGDLLGHEVHVRSRPGKGSVFSIMVPLASGEPVDAAADSDGSSAGAPAAPRTGAILVVDDDPDVRETIALVLADDGHRVVSAPDGAEALASVARGMINPDLILADYNLPGGLDGLRLAAKLRAAIGRNVPLIILTGDISTEALRDIGAEDCLQLNKPVKLDELSSAIRRLLPPPRPNADSQAGMAETPVIYIVDDDRHVREAIRAVLEDAGRIVEEYATCEAFLDSYRHWGEGCLLIDAYLPGMTGLELLRRLAESGHQLPAIMITGNSDVGIAVQAMKAGAADFIEKPISGPELLASIDRALENAGDLQKRIAFKESAASHLAVLTPRQRQIMDLVLAGKPSKNIAADLGISQRTVENHRASIMKKSGAKSLPALARLALAGE